jgi:L-lactate dehydrogenase complex protein LldG
MTEQEKSVSSGKPVLLHKFESAMDSLGGNTIPVMADETPTQLRSLLSHSIQTVGIYQGPLMDQFIPKTFADELTDLSVTWLPANKPAEFDERVYRQKMITMDAGLIAADYLIADSGTIVLFGKNHRAQMITLLPPKLFVLGTIRQLIPDMFTFHEAIEKETLDRFESMHYITGPSRTSDIEKKLILGVHGPKELCVVIVQQ